ncbi:MAG: hypothetical protein O2974_08845, partial [Chloroflexi bacterium]|nr:hypothetical protein [Chloroflexota bacterium]
SDVEFAVTVLATAAATVSSRLGIDSEFPQLTTKLIKRIERNLEMCFMKKQVKPIHEDINNRTTGGQGSD